MEQGQQSKGAEGLSKKLLLCFLVLSLVFSFAACKRKTPEPEPEQEPVTVAPPFYNSLPFPDKPDGSAKPFVNGLNLLAEEKHQLNSDTIGWLQVPGTSIADPVLFYPSTEEKHYYLRRDFYGNDSWNGSYYVDFRSQFEGGRKGLSLNTVVYGHSMEDNPDGPMFSQLKRYRDPAFAAEHPYLLFSTLDEDYAWEVFSVFISTIDFNYNNPNPTEEEQAAVLEEARARSMYQYEEVDVSTTDKIITLSTCIYRVNGVLQGYPNNYRYVVMGRLVPLGEDLKETAVITENTDMIAA